MPEQENNSAKWVCTKPFLAFLPCSSCESPSFLCSISFTKWKTSTLSLSSERHSARNQGDRTGSLNRPMQSKTQRAGNHFWLHLNDKPWEAEVFRSLHCLGTRDHPGKKFHLLFSSTSDIFFREITSKWVLHSWSLLNRSLACSNRREWETQKLRCSQGPSLNTAFVYSATDYKPAFKFERLFCGSFLWKHVTIKRAASHSLVNSAYFQFIFHRLLHP